MKKLTIILVALLCAAPSSAQMIPGLQAMNIEHQFSNMRRSIDTTVNSQVLSPEGAPPAVGVSVDFSFRSSPARTQQNLRNFIAKTPDPAGRAELQKMVEAQPTIIEDIGEGIKSYGYDAHDVADAYAMWWMMAWLASEVRLQEPDLGMAQNVSRQVRNAIAATPDFANTTDAERQEYAEALLLQAMILAELIKAAGDDPEIAAQLPAIARKGAKESGLDLSLMTLTPNGFVPRKGADASGAVAGEDDTIRNARADTPASEGESSGLGLALGAGAGLGVTLLGGLALMRRG